jgi:hypothetical protein
MPESLVDSLEGEGKVFNGDTFVADVRFKVRVYQQYEVSRTLAEGASHIPTLKRLELEISAPSRRIPMSIQVYRLHMGSGGKLNFFMSSPTTTTATGGIF